MIQPPFSSAIAAQLHHVRFLTTKAVVRKHQENDGQTGSLAWTRQCLRKGEGGGGYRYSDSGDVADYNVCFNALSAAFLQQTSLGFLVVHDACQGGLPLICYSSRVTREGPRSNGCIATERPRATGHSGIAHSVHCVMFGCHGSAHPPPRDPVSLL